MQSRRHPPARRAPTQDRTGGLSLTRGALLPAELPGQCTARRPAAREAALGTPHGGPLTLLPSQDSNLEPPAPDAGATAKLSYRAMMDEEGLEPSRARDLTPPHMPVLLLAHGAPGGTRTPDLLIKSE